MAGDYLDKRLGLGRQCWNGPCDNTPCKCPKDYKRAVKRAAKRKAKSVTAKLAKEEE